jgi:hypothetical protein
LLRHVKVGSVLVRYGLARNYHYGVIVHALMRLDKARFVEARLVPAECGSAGFAVELLSW